VERGKGSAKQEAPAGDATQYKNEHEQHGDPLESTKERAADRNPGTRSPNSTAPREESDDVQQPQTERVIQYVGEVMGQGSSQLGSRNAARETSLSEDDIAWGTTRKAGNEGQRTEQTIDEVFGNATVESNPPPDVLKETSPDQHEEHESPAQQTAEQVTAAGPHAIQRAEAQKTGQPWFSRVNRWFTGKRQ
jgi:hypothetical protein